MIMHVVTPYAIVVDLRGSELSLERQAEKVHMIANEHFFGDPNGLVVDRKGTYLGTNTIRKYHVASVALGLWVVATRDLTPRKTRPMARRIVEG